MSDSLSPHGLQTARLLYPWKSPGKNTRGDNHSLLQGVFLTQGSKPRSLALQADSLPSERPGEALSFFFSPIGKDRHKERMRISLLANVFLAPN